MNKRLEMLEKMLASGNADSFARYALALEYKREGRTEDALAAFTALREVDPDYLPMYLMAGQLLIDTRRSEEAKDWLLRGIELAKKKGEGKAQAELEAALAVT
ncbi:MAG: tetratricopeptide repeat protein [Myxococcales bacterium]|nr:tetratricopeptide repeat protein [Myxococcales bacterium]